MGKLPVNQVNPEQKAKFLAQERGKKRDLLQKFLNVCSASQVKLFLLSTRVNSSVSDWIDIHNYENEG